MYTCTNCDEKFEESDAVIVEYGTGTVLSKVELLHCPNCGSTAVKDIETGKVQ